MKLALLLAMLATATSWAAVPPDCDLTRLLAAIRAKEQGGEDNAYGIRRSVWDQHMGRDGGGWAYSCCSEEPQMARACAIKHLNWLANELSKAGYPPSVFCIAAAYHLGLRGYIEAARAGREIPYAKDVQNLYQSDSASKIATISPP